MTKYSFESVVGFFVIVLCVVFSYRVYRVTSGSYSLSETNIYFANFSNVDGISVGTDVKLGGVKIGTVRKLNIDTELRIIIEMKVTKEVRIPSDSSLVISSSGLLGGRYLEIKPGIKEEFMENNNYFNSTKSVVSLEELISKFAFK